MNILILGYYGKNNLGDELFVKVFENLFHEHSIIIKNINDVKTENTINNVDIVIIGGGDLMNDYFLVSIKKILKDFKGPVIGLSLGFPYKNILNFENLDIFDRIITRNESDVPIIKHLVGDIVDYCPDISLFLENDKSIIPVKNKNSIAFCLAKDYFKDSNTYFFNKVKKYIQKLSHKFNVTLIAFNTNEDNINENDTDLNLKIAGCNDKIKQVNLKTYEDAIKIFNDVDICICSRFHSCILSIITDTLFVPLYTSRKIEKLCESIGIEDYGYKIIKDSKDVPIDLDYQILTSKIDKILKNQNDFRQKINSYKKIFENNKYKITSIINNIKDFTPRQKENYIEKTINELLKRFGKNNLYEIEDKELLCKLICLKITGHHKTKYNYGLLEKLKNKDFDYITELSWLRNDSVDFFSTIYNNKMGIFNSKKSKEISRPGINLTYIYQGDLKGYHRSGWQYVVESLCEYSDEKDRSILVDTYVDRTFIWDSSVFKSENIIPYKKPWVGFIHHTFDTDYSSNNIYTILNNPYFIESLEECKCLFVLSKYIRDKLRTELLYMNIRVPVKALVHPTEDVEDEYKFSMKKYMKNPEKKLVQIGAWLRDTYAIYRTQITNKSISKHVLKGECMDNYYESLDNICGKLLFDCNCDGDIIDYCRGVECGKSKLSCCRSKECNKFKKICDNKYILGLVDYICDLHESVRIIKKLDNQQYDELLSKNIVFLNLVDASAVNTIIECYIRNTPVIVNRLPAIVEILGENYPLFYDDVKEVDKLTNIKNIKKAHKYLKNLDKNILNIDYFINKFFKKLNKIK